MIQQLFPGRTRTQVRLKYKKEEQCHPSRIHDALTNRAKGKCKSDCYSINFYKFLHDNKCYLVDHSRFEQVIARLKQIAAEENQNDEDIDESIDLTGEEAVEVTSKRTYLPLVILHVFIFSYYLQHVGNFFGSPKLVFNVQLSILGSN